MDKKQHYWVESAWEWLIEEYPNVDYSDLLKNELSWHFHQRRVAKGYDKARCTVRWVKYQEEINSVYIFLIDDITVWSTYRLKAVGMYAPTMRVSERFALRVQAVHEFTHYIQAMQGRDFQETEAVFNEIKFAFDTNFDYFKNCKVLMDQRYNINEDIKCIV